MDQNIIAAEKKKNLILNEKTFSGPMGMGLSKSYELEKKKKYAFIIQSMGKKKLY